MDSHQPQGAFMHPRNLLAAAIAADDSETLDTIFIKT